MSGKQPGPGRGRGGVHGGLPFHQRGRGGGVGYGSGRGNQAEVQVFSHGDAGPPAQPDARVRKTEDEIEKSGQTQSTPKKSALDQHFPLRPGFGTQGSQIMLWANYFELVAPPELQLFRYNIKVTPVGGGEEPKGKKLKRIIELLLDERLAAYRRSIATDYKANLICRTELPIEPGGYRVRYRIEGDDQPTANARIYHIRLQAAVTLAMSQLLDYLTSTWASGLLENKEEMIQALNIVVGHHPKTAPTIFSIGANKHFDMPGASREATDLGAGLKAIRGFFVSVRAATSRLLVNVQVKHTACYTEGPLEELVSSYLRAGNNLVRLGKFLKRLRIHATHLVRKNSSGRDISRIRTIAGLATSADGQGSAHPPIVPSLGAGARAVQFFLGTPAPGFPVGYISIYDFFHRKYNITVRDAMRPVINVGTRQEPTYLPVDVCRVLAGQPARTTLSPAQTDRMIQFAVRKPAQNAQSIVTSGARVLGVGPPSNATLTSFGIGVTPKLIAVPGRVLTAPAVKYEGIQSASTRDGSWNLQKVQFATATRLPSWKFLFLSCPSLEKDAWNSREELTATLSSFQTSLQLLGIQVGACDGGVRLELSGTNNDAKIDMAVEGLVKDPTAKPPMLLLVILPTKDTAMYNRVKLACDVRLGLRNVCVVGHKFKGRGAQYWANVGMKLNLKLGGKNHMLEAKKLGVISEGKTMVVGIDVTHPSPGSSSNAPSVAGIVASVDPSLAQWPADLRIQTARQEMVADLDGMLKSRLRLWAKNNNNAYPENILIYRDGVSEGQYKSVLTEELPLLRKACKDVYPASDTRKGLPCLSVIIVGKRHHTRFYPTKKENADKHSNPKNGTVVDRGVTEARNWDFFLQAHTALTGTARPAHYYIIHDEIFRSRNIQPPFRNTADMLEDLTHNMCYLFGRASKAVSICPPAYYADLLCERARCYLSRLFDVTPASSVVGGDGGGGGALDASDVRIHENVRDTMFYI